MAPHSCKTCLREIVQEKMEPSKGLPMEVSSNGTGANGWTDNPCKFNCSHTV